MTPEQQRTAMIFRASLRRAGPPPPGEFSGPDAFKAEAIEACRAHYDGQKLFVLVQLLEAGEFDNDIAGLFGHY